MSKEITAPTADWAGCCAPTTTAWRVSPYRSELMRTLDEKERLRLKAELCMEAEGEEDPTRS